MEVFRLVGRLAVDGVQETLNNLDQAASRFDRVAKGAASFGQTMQAAGERITGVGAGLSANVTAPIAAIGVAAGAAASQFDEANGRIQAQLGVSKAEADKMTESAKNLWAQGFGEDVGAAADAIANVGQNIKGLPADQMDNVAKKALTIQEAFDEDVNASTATASVLMQNFGIDANKSFDLMTAGFQSGANFSGELLDTMREYAPQFASAGMSAEEMMSVLISGAEAGAFNLDKVGDAVKEFNIRAKDGSDSTAEGFKAIGMNADEMGAKIAAGGEEGKQAFNATIAALAAMEDPVKRNTAGVALFGTQWEDLEANVITSMTTSSDKLKNVEGATDRAGKALKQNFNAQLQQTMRGLAVALEPLGRVLLDMAQQWLPVVQQKVQALSNWFGSLTASQKKWIVTLGLAAAAAGPLLVALGTVVTVLGGAIVNFANAARLIRTFSTSMNLVTRASQLGSGAMRLLTGTFNLVTRSARLLGVALRFLATNPIGLIIVAITSLVAIGVYLYKNWDTIGPKLSAIWNKVKTAVSNIVTALVNNLKARFNKAKSDAIAIFTAIGNFLSQLWTGTKNVVSSIINSLVNAAVTRFNNLKARAQAIFTALRNVAVSIWTGFKNTITNIINAYVNFCVRLFTTLKTRTQAIFTGLKNAAVSIWTGLRNTLANLATSAKDKIVGAWNTLKTRSSQLFGDIKTALSNKVKEFVSVAEKIPGMIGKGISNAASKATDSIKTLADKLVKKFKAALGIHSPSKVFEGMGGHIIDGLINGLKNNDLSEWGKEMFKDFAGGALNSLDAIKAFLSGGSIGAVGGKGAAAAKQWILAAMKIAGVPLSWLNPLMTVAKKESGFNPRAINLWDINAKRGYPSRGLFQTIPQTFAQYKMPGLNDIYNPIHNAVAAIRYMIARYGSVFNLPGIKGMARGGGYKGYEKGGIFTGPSLIRVAETSRTPVEAAVPLAGRYMWPFADAIGQRIAARGGDGSSGDPIRIVVEVPVILNGREVARQITPEIDVELARRKQREARASGRRI